MTSCSSPSTSYSIIISVLYLSFYLYLVLYICSSIFLIKTKHADNLQYRPSILSQRNPTQPEQPPPLVVIQLDLSADYDMLNHQTLLSTLSVSALSLFTFFPMGHTYIQPRENLCLYLVTSILGSPWPLFNVHSSLPTDDT